MWTTDLTLCRTYGPRSVRYALALLHDGGAPSRVTAWTDQRAALTWNVRALGRAPLPTGASLGRVDSLGLRARHAAPPPLLALPWSDTRGSVDGARLPRRLPERGRAWSAQASGVGAVAPRSG
eukprot:3927225-Pleurochrysis_carterae.AAC.1